MEGEKQLGYVFYGAMLRFLICATIIGPTWGDQGYIKLAREMGPPEGQCGVAMVPSYPVAEIEANVATVMSETKPKVESDEHELAAKIEFENESWAKIATCKGTSGNVEFTDLTISPKSPIRGQPIHFQGMGTLKEEFKSASFHLDVKMAGMSVFGHDGNMCGKSSIPLPLGLGHINIDGFACPASTGAFQPLQIDVILPSIAPSAEYKIEITSKSILESTMSTNDLFCIQVHLSLEDQNQTVQDAMVAIQ